MEIEEEFGRIHPDDLWVYNKLQLSLSLGYLTGPIGAKVPKEGEYIIRPCINFLGMGRNARKIWLTPADDTSYYGHPGEFWCETFDGDHLSVDFCEGNPVLVVKGTKMDRSHVTIEESRWEKWEVIDKFVKFPLIFRNLLKRNKYVNIEYIGGRIIEAHFRTNPDFVWGNRVAIPVYKDQKLKCPPGYAFIESEDYDRRGFYIR